MRKGRLSKLKQDRLLEYFVAGVSARCAASLVGVNPKSAAYYFHCLRGIITHHIELENQEIVGDEIEVDESYFGGTRKGKRGRGAAGKVPVFGLLKRGGVCTQRLFPMLAPTRYCQLFNRKLFLIVLFIVSIGEDIMPWMSQSSNIIVLTIQSSLLISTTTLMV
jgi:transposase